MPSPTPLEPRLSLPMAPKALMEHPHVGSPGNR